MGTDEIQEILDAVFEAIKEKLKDLGVEMHARSTSDANCAEIEIIAWEEEEEEEEEEVA